MNTNTGMIYPTVKDALADLKPGESEADVVEVVGDPETVAELGRSIERLRAAERRHAANKAARAARRHNR